MATVAASRAPATAPGDIPSTHPYTCQTCQIALRSSELQRAHMRSDWHRYNLKRRVTSLPPISADVFQSKVIDAQASATTAATRASFEKTCGACEKTYFSENAFYNHVQSKKHLKQMAQLRRKAPADSDAASVVSSNVTSQVTATVNESDEESEEEHVKNVTEKLNTANVEDEEMEDEEEEKEVEVPLKRCLFCNYESPTLDLNVTHMERIHNMFIPERQYLVDLEGLITSLWEKINILQECLTCGKLKPTVFGLQTHMRDKSHCSIPFHTENEQLEIGEFYDFRGTYSDEETDSEDEEETKDARASAASKLGAARKAKVAKKVAQDDEDEEMEDEGWETDSSVSSLDSADLTAVPLSGREHRYEKLDRHPHHAAGKDPRPHKTADGYHSHAHKKTHAAYFDEYELHLPSGRAVGHRSLAKYFKQNLHNHPSPAERQEQYMIEQARHDSDAEEERDSRVVARENRERGRALNTRAAGGRGMMGVAEHKKKEVEVKLKKAQKQENYDRQKFNWGVNKQNNSQKHWRDHLLQ